MISIFSSTKWSDEWHGKLYQQIMGVLIKSQYSLNSLKVDDEHFGNAIAVIYSNNGEKTYRFIHDRGDIYIEEESEAAEWKPFGSVPHEIYIGPIPNPNPYSLLVKTILDFTSK